MLDAEQIMILYYRDVNNLPSSPFTVAHTLAFHTKEPIRTCLLTVPASPASLTHAGSTHMITFSSMLTSTWLAASSTIETSWAF